jgi:putative tryptophan/tyrosine transport system substrate-binding protein
MRRREFITLLGGAAAWPIAARAQQAERMRRIGVIMAYSADDPEAGARTKALESGLQKFRWEQGRNIIIEYRFGAISSDRVDTFVHDLVRLHCDVILAHTPASLAALQAATRTIPILFVQSSDPIQLGLVTSLASPEANITGFVAFEASLGGKWLQMLHDAAPQLERVLVLQGRDNPSSARYLRSIETVAPMLGVSLSTSVVSKVEDIERSIATFAGNLSAGLLVLPSPITSVEYAKFVVSAAHYRVSAIYPFRHFVAAGGLMYYGPENIVDQWRQAASYIDRLFAGAHPHDLPVQLPTKFELIINLKTANDLGLTIPRDFLLIADEVIE